MKHKASKRLSLTWVSLLCISCFFLGVTFTSSKSPDILYTL
ncbi:unnamed protein product, partial [Brassica oleracea var. botrytis]